MISALKLFTRCENSERFPIPIPLIYAFSGRERDGERKQCEPGPKVRVLKGKVMVGYTGKTRSCNHCEAKRKVLLDCVLLGCALGQ